MPEPLKNRYSAAYINTLGTDLKAAYAAFPAQQFAMLVLDTAWPDRELKDRMTHITRCLQTCLPDDYRTALAILGEVAPGYGSFEGMFFPEFVSSYGLDDWEVSLPALAHFTQFSSSEFAVRPFILKDSSRMMTQMLTWARDDNYHSRRLASEGSRPRLPWAMALPDFKREPAPLLPILELLKDDSEEYVRRSVANNLNDISKDHPALILSLARSWLGDNGHRDRLVKHACRTLLKAGNLEAMGLFGFEAPTGVEVINLQLNQNSLAIGERMGFSFDICCAVPGLLRLEYAVRYAKADGKQGRKVFKISERDYQGGTTTIQRQQAFANLSTRKHHAGEHGLEILLNGHIMAATRFELTQAIT